VGENLKERLSKGRFGISVSHGTILAFAALILILVIAFTIRVLPLRWENLTAGTSYLNEFDPYYQLSITRHMLDYGLLSPYTDHWVNTMKWFPTGLDMSTSLPALPMTAAVLYSIASVFGKIDLMTFAAILPAFIAAISCLVMYFVGKDMGGRAVGLLSALFLALAPSYLQRSSLGFFDTEIPGVLGLVLFIFFFMRCMDSNRGLKGSILYAVGAGLSLAYFIAGWGAAYYILDLAALFVFVLVLLKRYTPRMLINYSLIMGIGLMIGTQVPYIGLGYLTSAAVLPVAAVFIVLLAAELLRNNITIKSKLTMVIAALVIIVGAFVALWLTGSLASIAGKFVTVLDPFIRSSSALVSSVAEQRITAWGNLYTEFGITILFFLVGMFFTLRNPTNRNVFLLLFSVTGLYFASSMIRLLVIFAPAFAIVAAIGIMGLTKPFYALMQEAPHTLAKSKRRMARVSKEYSGVAVLVIFMMLVSAFAFSPQTGGTPRSVSNAYAPTAISASSLPLGGSSLTEPVTGWLDALNWLNQNADSNTVVASWWDYGNWLSDIGNVTTIADNTTVNATSIANLGFAFMGTENQTLTMLSQYGQEHVKYIVVFEVLYITQSGETWYTLPIGYGDEGKWMWMARISGSDAQRFIDSGLISNQSMWIDESSFGETNTQTQRWDWNARGNSTTIAKILYDMQARYTANATAMLGQQVYTDHATPELQYLTPVYIGGADTRPDQFGALVPLIGIYEINWKAYNAANP
jgi:dolichyl-diphosphooligosaccharide---protein glycosyltransferase